MDVIIFNYKNQKISIQCSINQHFKEISNYFIKKENIDLSKTQIIYYYNVDKIDDNIIFNKIVLDFDIKQIMIHCHCIRKGKRRKKNHRRKRRQIIF